MKMATEQLYVSNEYKSRFLISKTRCFYVIGISIVATTLFTVRCLYSTECSWVNYKKLTTAYRPINRSSEFGNLTTQSCEPLHPRVVFYNRIFKAASSATSDFLKKCSAELGNLYIKDLTEEWENENISHPVHTRIKQQVALSKKINKRLMAIAHLYFREDIDSAYINLLREPIARFISHYYYCRSTTRWPIKIKILKKLGHFNVTIEECLENQYEGCVWNHMTRFFCGPHAFCKTGSDEALSRAKHNMLHYYATVGVVEYLTKFMEVLHKRLPDFVTAPPKTGLRRKHVTKGVEKKPISESTMKRLRSANKADIELYSFAKDIFLKQAANCGVKIES